MDVAPLLQIDRLARWFWFIALLLQRSIGLTSSDSAIRWYIESRFIDMVIHRSTDSDTLSDWCMASWILIHWSIDSLRVVSLTPCVVASMSHWVWCSGSLLKCPLALIHCLIESASVCSVYTACASLLHWCALTRHSLAVVLIMIHWCPNARKSLTDSLIDLFIDASTQWFWVIDWPLWVHWLIEHPFFRWFTAAVFL